MNETDLTRELTLLDPEPAARARIDARVERDLDAAETSLLEEWLNLIRVRPLVTLSFATAAAGALLVSTPLGALSLMLLR